jgi:CRISPR-associated protein Cmr5
MPINTRNQRYAGQIYDQVESVPATQREKYEGIAHKLPVLIRTAGLAQALAFVAASKEAAHQLLLNHLSKVVGAETSATLLERSRTDELAKYMRLTQEVLTALLWYKRFAQTSVRGGKA